MLRYPFKKIAALALVAVIACSFSGTAVYQTNFSGTWTLNESKSELGQMGRGASSKIVVDQKADGITLTRTTMGMDGSPSDATETLSEGKESESTVFGGMAKKKSKLKWAEDGNTFSVASVILIDRDGQSMEIKTAETWSLSADGKTLMIANNISTPQGELSTKAVYDKKP